MAISSFVIAYLVPIDNDILKIVITVLEGAIIYIGSLLLLREDLVSSFVRKK